MSGPKWLVVHDKAMYGPTESGYFIYADAAFHDYPLREAMTAALVAAVRAAEQLAEVRRLVQEMADPNIDVLAYRKAWRALAALTEGDG